MHSLQIDCLCKINFTPFLNSHRAQLTTRLQITVYFFEVSWCSHTGVIGFWPRVYVRVLQIEFPIAPSAARLKTLRLLMWVHPRRKKRVTMQMSKRLLPLQKPKSLSLCSQCAWTLDGMCVEYIYIYALCFFASAGTSALVDDGGRSARQTFVIEWRKKPQVGLIQAATPPINLNPFTVCARARYNI